MAAAVVVTVIMAVVIAMVIVMMVMAGVAATIVDAELRGADPGPIDLLGVYRHAVEREAAEGGAELVERQPGVEQGAEHHVARRAGETVEVEDLRHRTRSIRAWTRA